MHLEQPTTCLGCKCTWCIYNLNWLHGILTYSIQNGWSSAYPPPAQTATELLLHGRFYL